jgi:hypothetical protein
MVFEKPDGSSFERTAQATGAAAPGAMQYVTKESDLVPYGLWGVQGFVRFPGESGRGKRTSVVRFRVYPNVRLEDVLEPPALEVGVLNLPTTTTGEDIVTTEVLFQIITLPPTLDET